METVYIDECGFTGQDLLNENQPYFVLASLHMDEPSALSLNHQFFSEVQATELKFKKLKKHRSRQLMILKFIEFLISQPELFKITFTNKRYALLCKIVDIIVETAMHKMGKDAYKTGFNLALANVLWYTLPVFRSEEFLHSTLARFQRLMVEGTQDTFDYFFNLFENLKHIDKDPLDFVSTACKILTIQDLQNTGKLGLLDITITNFLILMSQWRAAIPGKLRIIHDESSNVRRVEEIWRKLTDPNLAEITIGYDSRTMKLPIQVEEIQFLKSSECPGLQLADVLAGAVNSFMIELPSKKNSRDKFHSEIRELMKEKLSGHGILPSPHVTPTDLGTVGSDAANPIETISKITGPVK